MPKPKLIRVATVPSSLNGFCYGMFREMSCEWDVIALSSPGTALEEIKERERIRTIAVPMERRISLKKDIKSLHNLIKVFRKEKPLIVHSNSAKAGLLCMIAAWITRVPIRIHTFTGLVFPIAKGIKRKILMLTDAITCFCATNIIPEGEGVKKDLLENKLTKKDIKVLGYGSMPGIDISKFKITQDIIIKSIELRQKLKIRDGDFVFLFVGRIVGDKGINELIEAYASLHSTLKNIKLLLVGHQEANLDPLKEKTLNEIQQNDSIIYVGPKYGEDLLVHYVASNCFVFPSYREGFPNVVLEAGAMELPSIVTDINGSREIIIHRKNGLIVPSKDTSSLVEAMIEIIKDKKMYSEMKSSCRKLITSRYEQSFVRQNLYNYYREIVRNNKIK